MNKFQWNFNRNSYIVIQENLLENTVWKMTAFLMGCIRSVPDPEEETTSTAETTTPAAEETVPSTTSPTPLPDVTPEVPATSTPDVATPMPDEDLATPVPAVTPEHSATPSPDETPSDTQGKSKNRMVSLRKGRLSDWS